MDAFFMQQAIEEAQRSARLGEVPIGCVIVLDGKIIARAHNGRIANCDPTAHAEIVALRRAGASLGRWNLSGCTVYVTLEPCVMCAGAMVNARISRLVFGATDARFGGCVSQYAVPTEGKLNHTLEVEGGVLAQPCAQLLTDFFRARRQ